MPLLRRRSTLRVVLLDTTHAGSRQPTKGMPASHHSHCDCPHLPTPARFACTPSTIAVEVGIPRATVYRIKNDPARAVALLETWGIS
jgi:hypothetical protein